MSIDRSIVGTLEMSIPARCRFLLAAIVVWWCRGGLALKEEADWPEAPPISISYPHARFNKPGRFGYWLMWSSPLADDGLADVERKKIIKKPDRVWSGTSLVWY